MGHGLWNLLSPDAICPWEAGLFMLSLRKWKSLVRFWSGVLPFACPRHAMIREMNFGGNPKVWSTECHAHLWLHNNLTSSSLNSGIRVWQHVWKYASREKAETYMILNTQLNKKIKRITYLGQHINQVLLTKKDVYQCCSELTICQLQKYSMNSSIFKTTCLR